MKPLSITISPPDYQERTSMQTIFQTIADEVSVKMSQVEAAVQLLDDGATVPFIARYRKEVTQGLDDTQLRLLAERLEYLRELNKRRESILHSIQEQGKLTDDLKERLQAASTRTALEDLYLPYKPKRRTKAQMAREAGLQALADALLHGDIDSPEALAEQYLNNEQGVDTAQAALDGARQILMETFAENADLMTNLREYLWEHGVLSSSVIKGKEAEGDKFKDYFTYEEAIKNIPSHRALALFRGRTEGILSLNLDVVVDPGLSHPCEAKVALAHQINPEKKTTANEKWLLDTVRRAWKVKIHSKLDIELKMRLRESAEQEAIRVFSNNLKDLLLAAPAGAKVTMGLDPGLRTGVKVAVVDFTGKLLDTGTIYPHAPRNQWDQSIETLQQLAEKHGVELISIGNGTASRETDKLVGDLSKRYPGLKLTKLVVSEAGASVYSASELAAKEFPDLDVSLRGAVSIARRLQDPLAELVKIESKAIGVGQYQHDVNQVHLAKSLHAVVEDCVNAVGVDVNTASVPLLTEVAGLTVTLAENIVAFRDEHGAFSSRQQLQDVKRMGPKAFEQAAGFLRIRQGENPLDASAVHPEAYPIVEKIAVKTGLNTQALIGRSEVLKSLNPVEFANEQFGIPTIKDILSELDKPGRDPRPEFVTASFREGVETMADLEPGMVLEGVVSNVTNFGAFVDIGVHQDGLVHISQLADKFVQDPRDIVKAGDVVNVRVEEIEVERKRIALTMRLNDQKKPPEKSEQATLTKRKAPKGKKRASNQQAPVANNAIQEAFLKASRGKN